MYIDTFYSLCIAIPPHMVALLNNENFLSTF